MSSRETSDDGEEDMIDYGIEYHGGGMSYIFDGEDLQLEDPPHHGMSTRFTGLDDYEDEAEDCDLAHARAVDPFCGSVSFQHEHPLRMEGADAIDMKHFTCLLAGDTIEPGPLPYRFTRGLEHPPTVALEENTSLGAVAINLTAYRAFMETELQLQVTLVAEGHGGFSYAPCDHNWGASGLSPQMVLELLLYFRAVIAPKAPSSSLLDEHDVSSCPDSPSAGSHRSVLASSPHSHRLVEEATCSLCMEIMLDPCTLRCGHSGCLECITRARGTSTTCPTCRVDHSEAVTVSITLRNLIDSLFADETSYRLRKDASFRRELETRQQSRHLREQHTLYFHERNKDLEAVTSWEEECKRLFHREDAARLLPVNSSASADHSDALWITIDAPELSSEPVSEQDDVYIPNQSLYQLLRCAGCLAVDDEVCSLLRDKLALFTSSVLRRCVSSLVHRGASLLTSVDVQHAIRTRGIVVYGYGIDGYKGLWTKNISFILCQVVAGIGIAPSGIAVINDLCTDILLRLLHSMRTSNCLPRAYKSFGTHNKAACTHLLPYLRLSCSGEGVVLLRNTLEVPVPPLLPLDTSTMQGATIADVAYVRHVLKDLLVGELYNHGLHEGDKAVCKMTSSEGLRNSSLPLDTLSNLVFSPEKMALLALREENLLLTEGAAVFVASTVEYIAAEVLELAGNAARHANAHFIESHHIARAIRCDAELCQLFLFDPEQSIFWSRRGLIRGGCSSLGTEVQVSEESVEAAAATTFNEVLYSKAEQMPERVIVDPRDGLHYMAAARKGFWVPMHELDAACALPAYMRRDAARALLNPVERLVLEQHLSAAGELQSVAALHRAAQWKPPQVLPMNLFYALCKQLVRDLAADGSPLLSVAFTSESLQLLSEVAEWHLMHICHCGGLISRRLLTNKKQDGYVLTTETLNCAKALNIIQ